MDQSLNHPITQSGERRSPLQSLNLPLCETCQERGRARPGTYRPGLGVMCNPCFRGEGTRAENSGESATWVSADNARRKKIHDQADKTKLRDKARRYRREHPDRMRAAKARWREKARRIE